MKVELLVDWKGEREQRGTLRCNVGSNSLFSAIAITAKTLFPSFVLVVTLT